jgi:hypothetical protein
MTNANEEEEEEQTRLDAEAAERDRAVPPLQTYTLGIRAMASARREGVQSARSLIDDAFEAGEREGYALGYVDGHDAAWDAVICLIGKRLREIERGEL